LDNFDSLFFLILDSNIDRDVHWELFEIFDTIVEEAEKENPISETTQQLPIVQEVQDVQVQLAPQRELLCSQVNTK